MQDELPYGHGQEEPDEGDDDHGAGAGQPLDALETLASQWLQEHPEYDADLGDVDAALGDAPVGREQRRIGDCDVAGGDVDGVVEEHRARRRITDLL